MGGPRVGVIGTGFGASVVAPAFSAAGWEVLDVVSARDQRAVAGLCRREVDLIAVHSPPFLHATHVASALDAGRAVLCDKPFGRSAEEAAAMVDAARQAGVVHLVNFEFRHEPARLRLKELIGSGAIGRPEHLQWNAFNAGSRVPLRPMSWLFDRDLGGGWIGAWGSHAVDAIRWLLGDVIAAGATCRVTIAERPDQEGNDQPCTAEDGFTAWLTLEGGATAAIDTSFAAAATLPTRLLVTGSEGTIEVINDHRLVVRRSDGGREEIELEATSGDPHGVAMHRWAGAMRDAVAQNEQISPSFVDGLACARVLDAFRAGGSGRPIGRPV
jgi:predicted dehydrogenase